MPRLLKIVLLTLLICLTVSAQEEREPSREPVLRIETGMHTANIWRIGVDRAGKFLVTASDDKTARVWDLQTGRLLRVLRVPVGEGNEGRLYAAAISPDGNTIAAGGWTGYEWDKQYSLYLFDRESGRLVRRLTGLPNGVFHLAFSPDSALLAATFGSTNGVRVWRTSDWTEIGRDTDYGDLSLGADFDRAGRLVTSCFDGSVRLYDREMRLLLKQAVPGGKNPYAVRFSPDGRKVAVGYDDSTRVDVLNGETLALLYSADTSGINNGQMSSVAWSTDGTMLYAGGRYYDNNLGSRPIRRWSDAGRGRYVDTPSASSTVFDIAPLPTGGIVYGAADPLWGILDSQHKQTQPPQTGQIADYRDNSGFLTDAHAGGIRFGYEQFGKSPAFFQLSDRTLKTDAPASNDMRPPLTEAPGLSITDWKNTLTPRLNNIPLKLEPYEMSASLAIGPSNERFLLGTSSYIRFFNRSGQELWKVPAPGVAWAVNISGDGRVALAAYGDGTVRWYRMTDGKELLAFFPHKDRKRWILWTPSGYYDASPGAEDLIGWHVNNGRDAAADFFPAGQFRSTYYRPDVVALVLTTGDEQLALKQANEEAGRKQQQASVAQQLPPVVEIISPTDSATISSTDVTVRFRIRTPSGEPVTNIRALVDGRPIEGNRQLVQEAAATDGARELRISLPERDSTISVIAENRYAASVPANVRLKWRGRSAQAIGSATAESFVIKPKLYILAVGVSKYVNEKYNLQFADKDARDFASAMQAQKGLLYRDVVVKTLTNEQATKDEILDGLDWIRKETTSNDVAMVFFAGHGVNDQNNYYYFCPYNIDPERLLRTGVAFSDIKNAVAAIAGKAIFFVDTCHSGNSLGLAGRRGTLDINIVINELSSAENGAIVFSASTGSESSYERAEWNNGAFTKSLVEGLNGAASIGNSGRITYAMLNVYISERVKELTRGQQHPTMISPQTVPDFPVAVKK